MIKHVRYLDDHLEISFEWPLSEEVLKQEDQISRFINTITSRYGAEFVRDGDSIVGFKISNGQWVNMLDEHGKRSIERSVGDEMGRFMEHVKKMPHLL